MMDAMEKWKALLHQVAGIVSDCVFKPASINRPSFQLEESNDMVNSFVILLSFHVSLPPALLFSKTSQYNSKRQMETSAEVQWGRKPGPQFCKAHLTD